MTSEPTRTSPCTWAGLGIALLGYPIVVLLLISLVMDSASTTYALMGFAASWLLAGAVLLIVRRCESEPMSSIGWASLNWKDILLAIGIGIGLSLTVPLLTLLVTQIIPATDEGSIAGVAGAASPLLILLSVLTAGITEEVLFRAYPLERLTRITGQRWIAVVVAVVAFTLPHLVGWNTAHVVGVVLPLGVILSLLYLWKRNLAFNMIVHVLIDLPLVFIALLG